VGQRTAIINQIRCFLLQHGITVRQLAGYVGLTSDSRLTPLPAFRTV